MKDKMVSVIIPMYNVADYIEQCLTSILTQTYSNIELILIDDGSTDDTLNIAEIITKDSNNTKIYSIINQGPAYARNLGIEASKGEYIMFVDSDDYLSEEAIETLLKIITENNCLLALGRTLRTDGYKNWSVPSHHKYQVTSADGVKNIAEHTELFYSIGPAAKLYHHSLLDNNFFDSSLNFAEDQLFVLKTYLRSNKIAVTHEAIYFYRVRGKENQSLTQLYQKNTIENLKNILAIINDAYNMITIEKNYTVEEKKIMYLGYINRLTEIELRVLFKANYRESGVKQATFFNIVLEKILLGSEPFILLFSESANFKKYIFFELQSFYFLIRRPALPVYYLLIENITKLQNDSSQSTFLNKIQRIQKHRIQEFYLKIFTCCSYFIKRLGRRIK